MGTNRKFFSMALTTLALLTSEPVRAADSGYSVDHGITFYYAMIPAEMIRGHRPEHPEATMHGRVPSSQHTYHVMVALFDAQSLRRITDADVTASVAEIGFAGEQKRLEKFSVADAVTYGNYFEMRPNILYRIMVTVKAPDFKDEAHLSFEAKHERK